MDYTINNLVPSAWNTFAIGVSVTFRTELTGRSNMACVIAFGAASAGGKYFTIDLSIADIVVLTVFNNRYIELVLQGRTAQRQQVCRDQRREVNFSNPGLRWNDISKLLIR
jgi:hypothetical protein